MDEPYFMDNQPVYYATDRPVMNLPKLSVRLRISAPTYDNQLIIKGMAAEIEHDVHNNELDIHLVVPEDTMDALAGRLVQSRRQRMALNSIYGLPKFRPIPKKVIYNYPATIVFWDDGTKTVVKCRKGEMPDLDRAIAYAVCKKIYGNMSHFDKLFTRDAEVVIQKDHMDAMAEIFTHTYVMTKNEVEALGLLKEEENKEMELAIREVANLAKEQEAAELLKEQENKNEEN